MSSLESSDDDMVAVSENASNTMLYGQDYISTKSSVNSRKKDKTDKSMLRFSVWRSTGFCSEALESEQILQQDKADELFQNML
jgi:hypothetical protein